MMKKLLLIFSIFLIAPVWAGPNSGASAPDRASLPSTPNLSGTETISPSGDCSFVEINVSGEVTGENDLGDGNDQIRISVWDDGVEEAFEVIDAPVGETTAFDVVLSYEGEVGSGATGVGIVIYDGPTTADPVAFSEDPFEPTQVTGSCEGAGEARPVPVNGPVALVSLSMIVVLIGLGLLYRKN